MVTDTVSELGVVVLLLLNGEVRIPLDEATFQVFLHMMDSLLQLLREYLDVV